MTETRKEMLLARLEALKILLSDQDEIKSSDNYEIKNISLAVSELIGVVENIITNG